MKQKLLKSLLLAAAMLVGSGNVWADETVGESNLSTGYLEAHSTVKTIDNGSTLHYVFTMTKATDEYWKGWLLWVGLTGSEITWANATSILRGDNWEDKSNSNTGCANNFNFDTFNDDMNGATVDMYVSVNGTALTMRSVITTSTSTVYNYSYSKTLASTPESLDVCLSVNAAYLSITTAEILNWTTVWSADFSSVPTGISYSHPNATVSISNETLLFYNGSNGERLATVSFNADGFNVSTNWIMEYDWGASSPNVNSTTLNFNTSAGLAFSVSYDAYDGTATITSSTSAELTTTLPINNYPKAAPSTISHFKIEGDADNGIYLTVTYNGVVYVNQQRVSSAFGYPTTFSGYTGKAQNYFSLDNITFKTPAIEGFVATPTYNITSPDGTNRKFTLDCLTDNTTIYYAGSDLEKGAVGWSVYSGEVSTAEATIYAYAEDNKGYTSDKMNFATGAGTAITLNAPTFIKTAYADGTYTVTMRSDQSDLSIVPGSVTLKYSIDGGEEVAYSGAFALTDGETVAAHVESTGYANSSNANMTAYARPVFGEVWTLDFAGQATVDKGGVSVSETAFSAGGVDFGTITSDSYTSNDNFGVKTGTSWLLRNGGRGLYSQNGSGTPIGIANLTEGQYVVINCNDQADMYNSTSGVGEYKSDFSTSSQIVLRANADGNMEVNLKRYICIQWIAVYDELEPATMSIKADKWGTFIAPFDVTIPAGVEAYKVTGVSGTNLVKEAVETTIPANTPVVLNNTTGAAVNETFYGVNTASEDSYTVGYLTGVYTAATIAASDESNVRYVLQTPTSGENEGVQAFYKVASNFTATPNKCYLTVPVSPAPVKAFFFNSDDADAIGDVRSKMEDGRNEIYNLAGQRLSKAQKGINIVNGKKILVK